MARLFNGTSDALQTASAMTLGSPTKLAISFWLWWDTNGSGFEMAMETSDLAGSGDWTSNNGILVCPNFSAGGAKFMYGAAGDNASVAQPSTGTFHHHVVNFDVGQTGNHVISAYLDGASDTLTNNTTSGTNVTLGDNFLNFMDRAGGSLFGAGRMADVAIWTGINLSGTDVSNLNGGTLPTSVQSGNLTYYWKICGDNSPETATTGSLNLTVTGTTKTSHPSVISSSCSVSSPPPPYNPWLQLGPVTAQ